MNALRLADHASVIPDARVADGPKTRAAAAAAARGVCCVNALDSAEMDAVSADYAINALFYPALGTNNQAFDNFIHKHEDF